MKVKSCALSTCTASTGNRKLHYVAHGFWKRDDGNSMYVRGRGGEKSADFAGAVRPKSATLPVNNWKVKYFFIRKGENGSRFKSFALQIRNSFCPF